ncbi:hypothetical protein [Pandoraea sp. NPDC087047]|uniref:hypothetical protein n=1 Tax=Pandoraea sp. NPDC087047 TaxID=3364390 RepID=UPI0037FFCBBF
MRNVLVFAIDGITSALGLSCWKSPVEQIELASTFPTTSTTCWTSACTGEGAETHGIVGVVHTLEGLQRPINIFEYQPEICTLATGNFFHDAASLGYMPVALESDLTGLRCGWKDSLLKWAKLRPSGTFFSGRPAESVPIVDILRAVAEEVDAVLSDGHEPKLVWCFVDIDQWIHHTGYDEPTVKFLRMFDDICARWSERGNIVIAHSDHGLVETEHSSEVASVFAHVATRFNGHIGGAGRVRWIHSAADAEEIIAYAKPCLPDDVAILRREAFFPAMSNLIRQRVGAVLFVATGRKFVSMPGYCYDHGSLMKDELFVPYARWQR